MYSSLLQSVSARAENDLAERMVFLLDFVVFPVFGLVFLFVVYKLIKARKITMDRAEKRDGN